MRLGSFSLYSLFYGDPWALFLTIFGFILQYTEGKKNQGYWGENKEGGEMGRRCRINSVANIFRAPRSQLLNYCLSTPYPPPFCALLWCWDWGSKPYFFVANSSLPCPAHRAARETEMAEEEEATSSLLLDSLFLSVSCRQELFTWAAAICFCFQLVRFPHSQDWCHCAFSETHGAGQCPLLEVWIPSSSP